jgi:hypothetical protein
MPFLLDLGRLGRLGRLHQRLHGVEPLPNEKSGARACRLAPLQDALIAGECPKVKQIRGFPDGYNHTRALVSRLRNDWNARAPNSVSAATRNRRITMYIGLGGLLILILILWLLGVI